MCKNIKTSSEMILSVYFSENNLNSKMLIYFQRNISLQYDFLHKLKLHFDILGVGDCVMNFAKIRFY